jgi:polysaccharide biosynthesis protein PslE
MEDLGRARKSCAEFLCKSPGDIASSRFPFARGRTMIAIPQNDQTPTPTAPVHPLLRALQTVRRRWKLAALFFVTTMALVIVGVFVCPKSYRSEAKLFVRMGRESVTLDPTATTGQIVAVHESRENEINSVLDVIQSRVIFEHIVDAIGPRRILYGDAAAKTESKSSENQPAESSTSFLFDNSPIREKAIRSLEKSIRVTHSKKSSVIGIECKASSPKLAQEIVKEALNAFHVLHLKVNRTAGSHQFFLKQSNLLQDKLAKATFALRTAKTELGVVTMTGRQTSLQAQLRDNQTAIASNKTELASAQASIASLDQSLAELPKQLETQRIVGFPNGAADRSRQRLNELKIHERELLAKFTKRHPQVIALQKQILEAEEILKKETPRGAQSTMGTNPAIQQMVVLQLSQKSRVASLTARTTMLEKHSDHLLTQLKTLNAQEGTLALLTQDVELLRTSHRAYSEKLEQTRIDGALGEQRISNVNVVQPATYITKPVSPKKRIIVLLGAFVAALGAVGVAFLADAIGKSRKKTQTSIIEDSPSVRSSATTEPAMQ